MFLYSVSPLHMGAGTAIGVIDNPIQREVHTTHPVIAGSGIKGALRHRWRAEGVPDPLIFGVFGPEGDDPDHRAGAVSTGDGQLVLFPVRSLERSFMYVTSPLALSRLNRLLALAEADAKWQIPSVDGDSCVRAGGAIQGRDEIVLETYLFKHNSAQEKNVASIADWLAKHAMPGGAENAPFRTKLGDDLVVLSDERFGYFARAGTVVEPHVRIDDATGTADDGGLFYTENAPPECLFASLLMATAERPTKSTKRQSGERELVEGQSGNGRKPLNAKEVVSLLLLGSSEHHEPDRKRPSPLHDNLLQIGGDATTGRGLTLAHFHPAPPPPPEPGRKLDQKAAGDGGDHV